MRSITPSPFPSHVLFHASSILFDVPSPSSSKLIVVITIGFPSVQLLDASQLVAIRGLGVYMVSVGIKILKYQLSATIPVHKTVPLPSVIVIVVPISPVQERGIVSASNKSGIKVIGAGGGVWSVTCTVLVTILPVFPALSTYRYSKRYVHNTHVFTDPLITKLPVLHRVPVKILPVPSTLSVQYAHASVYHVHCATISVPLPFNTTIGAT